MIKPDNTVVDVVENLTDYAKEELLTLAQRDNNTKRKFLLINRKQGKHLPVDPAEALELFSLLGRRVQSLYGTKKIVVIGFAETATAIGAAVAAQFGQETLLLETSREDLPGVRNLVDFEEEHSHATSQRLYCADRWLETLRQAEVILFVEDEVTTGKTIGNFVEALTQSGAIAARPQFAVASLVNGLSDELIARYAECGIAYHYLLRGCYHADLDPYPQLVGQNPWQPTKEGGVAGALITLPGKIEVRCGVTVQEYEQACRALSEQAEAFLRQQYARFDGQILFLGTEEFMYPVMRIARHIAENFAHCSVKVHATTRSPIKISEQVDYPICNGAVLDSLYEKNRKTYIYNLQPYDHVIWITDSGDLQLMGAEDLRQALQHFGCHDILGIQWRVQ